MNGALALWLCHIFIFVVVASWRHTDQRIASYWSSVGWLVRSSSHTVRQSSQISDTVRYLQRATFDRKTIPEPVSQREVGAPLLSQDQRYCLNCLRRPKTAVSSRPCLASAQGRIHIFSCTFGRKFLIYISFKTLSRQKQKPNSLNFLPLLPTTTAVHTETNSVHTGKERKRERLCGLDSSQACRSTFRSFSELLAARGE